MSCGYMTWCGVCPRSSLLPLAAESPRGSEHSACWPGLVLCVQETEGSLWGSLSRCHRQARTGSELRPGPPPLRSRNPLLLNLTSNSWLTVPASCPREPLECLATRACSSASWQCDFKQVKSQPLSQFKWGLKRKRRNNNNNNKNKTQSLSALQCARTS